MSSSIPNRRACTFIDFEKKSPPAWSYSGLHVYWFWEKNPPCTFIPSGTFIGMFKRAIFQTIWKLHCCTKSLIFELDTSNCGYLHIFWFPLIGRSFNKIGQHWYQTFYMGPPFEFLVNCKIKKHQRGAIIKYLISMLSNLANSHNLKSLTQKTKIWCINAVSRWFGR